MLLKFLGDVSFNGRVLRLDIFSQPLKVLLTLCKFADDNLNLGVQVLKALGLLKG